jgi:GTPase involved in cell partitioning and DNA repair
LFQPQHFVDARRVRAIGGKGGDGAISFLQLWSNETAGPDGGDGGNGGHVVFKVSSWPEQGKHSLQQCRLYVNQYIFAHISGISLQQAVISLEV